MGSDQEVRRVWRVFFAWQDEKEERWLREMAGRGWHLRQVGLFVYGFERGEPADVVYKLDYRIVPRSERAEYEGLFREAGWEYAASLSNWHYFRTPARPGAEPDIFSDIESRVAKYRRLLGMLVILVPVLNIGVMNMLRHPAASGSARAEAVMLGVTALYLLLVGVWAYAVVRIALHIRRLRRRGTEEK